MSETKSESLYEMSAELMPLERALEAVGGDVTDNTELMERVTELLDKTQDKIDAYGRFYTNLSSRAKDIKAEEERLAERRKTIENKMGRLKDTAKVSMEMRNIVKIEGKLFTIAVQKNGGKQAVELLVPVDKLPERYQKVEVRADMEKIMQAVEVGNTEAKALVKILPRGTHVKIS